MPVPLILSWLIGLPGGQSFLSYRHSTSDLTLYDEAAQRLGRAVQLLPDDARIHYNLALVLKRLERSDAAESSLRNAMKVAPDDPDVLYALAFHYLNHGRLDEAEALGKRFVERHPERPEGGQLLEQISRQKEAKE